MSRVFVEVFFRSTDIVTNSILAIRSGLAHGGMPWQRSTELGPVYQYRVKIVQLENHYLYSLEKSRAFSEMGRPLFFLNDDFSFRILAICFLRMVLP